MKSVLKFIFFFVLPIGIFILWIGGFFSHRIPPGYAQENPKVVSGLKVEEVRPTEVYERYKIDGYTTSSDTAKVSTKLMGKVYKVNVREGDFVKKGQILAVVDHSDLLAQKEELKAGLAELKAGKEEALAGKKAAQAQFEFAKITYERVKNLYLDNAVPKQKLDEAKMHYDAAKAQLEQVEAKLKQLNEKEKQLKAKMKQLQSIEKYAYIRAPFDGYIIKKMIDIGDMSAPGMPAFIIGNKKSQFQSLIDAKYLKYIKVGDTLKIHIDALNEDVNGKIIEKNQNADPHNNSFSIKATLDKNLPVGLYGFSYIKGKKTKKILIPLSAIVRQNNITSVFVVGEDGILRLVPVSLGEVYGDKVEVKGGISVGDKIVVSNTEKACNGCRISL